MKPKYTLIAAALVLSAPVSAATSKANFPACITQAYIHEIVQASINKDNREEAQLIREQKCIVMKPGLQLSVISHGDIGVRKIRLYIGSQSIVLWTVKEGINP